MTILIVDDDVDDISFIKEVILEIDPAIEFIDAHDGADALKKLDVHAGAVGLIILDVKMPKLNGIECLSHIHKKFPGIPVVLFSSTLFHRIPEEDKKGAAACIPKPSNLTEMQAAGHIFVNMLYNKKQD